jgi:hypothetical protein
LGKVFTDDERQLFTKVSNNVKKYSDIYKIAGKWLDGYDERRFWIERECEFKIANGIRTHKFPIQRFDIDEDTLKKYEKHADRLEKILKSEEKPSLVSLLKDAWDDLEARYLVSHFLSDNDAKAVILITWLITDPDANHAHLGLTKFENWNWGVEEIDLPLNEGRLVATECVWFKNRGIVEQKKEDRKQICINIIRQAWAKIEAEMPAGKNGRKTKPLKRGRKKDQKIRTRNEEIAIFKANHHSMTYKEIGKEFGVSDEVVRKACNNKASNNSDD